MLDGPWGPGGGKISRLNHDPKGELVHPHAGNSVVARHYDEAGGGNQRRKCRTLQGDIGNIIAIEVSFDAGLPPAQCRQRIGVSVSVEIIKVDLDGATTKAGGKSDSVRAPSI